MLAAARSGSPQLAAAAASVLVSKVLRRSRSHPWPNSLTPPLCSLGANSPPSRRAPPSAQVFGDEDENKFSHTEVHAEFKGLVEGLLNQHLAEIGVS